MALAGALQAEAAEAEKVDGIETAEVRAVADLLGENPAGFGRPITDRPAWGRLAKMSAFRSAVREAEALLAKPLPDQPDDLYLEFSRNGNRSRWQRVAFLRRGRVSDFTIAECLENKGRFLPPLEETIRALAAERTWVMPAHDRNLANFKGEAVTIDLGSSGLAADLATAAYLLGDRLSPDVRTLIRENLQRRIFEPYHKMVAGQQSRYWLGSTNNWNAVCLANVTGAALAAVPSRDERAWFIVAARTYVAHFLRGFTPDGYCSEGLGYWHYGFGHYLLLSEAIGQATNGKIDMLARPEAREPAMFGFRIEIARGVCPAFADCSVGTDPSERMLHFIGRRFRLGAGPADDDVLPTAGGLFESMMYSFPNSATQAPPADAKAEGPGIRTWFKDAGVLIGRPRPGTPCRMGVAMKGGHNAEHHNHNDVGSYVVVVDDEPVLLDPGAEVYTARTFSGQRYESGVLNSFGHPVPRVAGALQTTGRGARGEVVRTEFTDAADTLVLDLRSAYKAPGLEKLERTFVYLRDGSGSLTVTDAVAFAEPQAFETALVTLGEWERADDGTIIVRYRAKAVRVQIQAEGGRVEFVADEIKEDVKAPALPTRIGIRFTEPVRTARVTLRITPESAMKGK
ncbi:MAG: heparinase II/III family protein [Planctomycetes bacterium]|nr:heparinase II/III family protein [Planctomycetota bacterium]